VVVLKTATLQALARRMSQPACQQATTVVVLLAAWVRAQPHPPEPKVVVL
jgi:hypothetical protein